MSKDWRSRPPKSLIDYHEGAKRSLAILRKSSSPPNEPLDAFFTRKNQPIMREVWEGLAKLSEAETNPNMKNKIAAYHLSQYDWGITRAEKRAAEERGQYQYEAACHDFYHACKGSLGIYVKTPGERRAELLEIAKKARNLAELVGSSELACTSVLYYERETLEGTQYPDGAVVPRIEELLISLAEEAEAATKKRHKNQIVSKLNRKPDGSIPVATYRTAFVKRLAAYMKEKYGRPCHQIVADTATVIFGIETDSEYVKSASRTP